MITLEPFRESDWHYIQEWIRNDKELIIYGGALEFSFPITKEQVEEYLSGTNRIVFKVREDQQIIGMAEISNESKDVVKISRVLIGERKMRGKGLCLKLVEKLIEFITVYFIRRQVVLNVFNENQNAINCYLKAGFKWSETPSVLLRIGDKEYRYREMYKSLLTHKYSSESNSDIINYSI